MSHRGRLTILREMQSNIASACPWSLMFAPTGSLTIKEERRLEEHLKEKFEHWAQTWIGPLITELASKEPVRHSATTTGGA